MLHRALDALLSACDPARDEIFVVDNGSSDGSPDAVAQRYPQVHLIRNTCNNGFARANNQAISRAQGEFLVLLNNDAFLAPDALERIAATFAAHPRAAVVAGQLLDAEGRPQRSAGYIPTALDELGLRFLRRRPRAPKIDGLTEVESVVGACMAVRTEAIRDAGSLDDDFFFYFEETEWCHRMRRHGWRVLVDPTARITHLKGASSRELRAGAQVEMLRSRLTFYRKTMNGLVAMLLSVYRVLRLLLNTTVHSLLLALTLAAHRPTRTKWFVYLTQVSWLVCGCPWHWGLPDKCPRRYDGGTA